MVHGLPCQLGKYRFVLIRAAFPWKISHSSHSQGGMCMCVFVRVTMYAYVCVSIVMNVQFPEFMYSDQI